MQLVAGSLMIAAGAYLIGGLGHPGQGSATGGRTDAASFAFAAAPLGTGLGYLSVGFGALAGLGLPTCAAALCTAPSATSRSACSRGACSRPACSSALRPRA